MVVWLPSWHAVPSWSMCGRWGHPLGGVWGYPKKILFNFEAQPLDFGQFLVNLACVFALLRKVFAS